ncbi:TPA: type VI secretion system ATPase TssH [Salmonella enterica]|uniref:Type VI secretion system ATPase TssH n=1 Tax=Salmonella enterica TaxID=28901 RepID=A0A747SQ07_SALER|nr:type VI secretion system ATPase TssH [Salmonella enterica]HAF4697580.1 type VI secretion system ATPase TssH [Salmonella enterica]
MSEYLKKMAERLTPDARACLDRAVRLSTEFRHDDIDVVHLLLAFMLQEPEVMAQLSQQAGLDTEKLELALRLSLSGGGQTGTVRQPVFSSALMALFDLAWLQASIDWQCTRLSAPAFPGCLLASQASSPVPVLPAPVMAALQCDTDMAIACLKKASDERQPATSVAGAATLPASPTVLEQYTHNLTRQAREGSLDPVTGRDAEVRQIINILLRRRQNNPVLTGEPGVGKTAIAEGLAQCIVAGEVPERLKSMELLTLDLGALQAGASVRGEFEQRLYALLDDIRHYPRPVILFIDEAHTLIGAGGAAGQNDAANLLKPVLARGELRILAATTWSEYKRYFEKDAALARRFQRVTVEEPDEATAVSMLRAVAASLSDFHQVAVTEDALTAAVRLSGRYITGRQLPDKAISLLDTACARVAVSRSHPPRQVTDLQARLSEVERERAVLQQKNPGDVRQVTRLEEEEGVLKPALDAAVSAWREQQELMECLVKGDGDRQELRHRLAESHRQHAFVFDCVDALSVADVLSEWTGIPLGRVSEQESVRLAGLAGRLQQSVLGQTSALEQIAAQLRISHAGLHDPVRPLGVFLLAGPSGVGKTETARALAQELYGSEQNMITINLSEYQEAHAVSGLKGSPPGYVGYGQGGVLTEAVRQCPYSVLLLDEVEKAHPDVLELFYQVFDRGMLEDSDGQQINFRNTVILMTSNVGAETILRMVSAGSTEPDELESGIRPECEGVFRPAFMGRVQLLPYLPLAAGTLQRIVEMKLQQICDRVSQVYAGRVSIVWCDEVVNYVVNACQIVNSGAREVDHLLSTRVLPPLAELLMSGGEDSRTRTVWIGVRGSEISLSQVRGLCLPVSAPSSALAAEG